MTDLTNARALLRRCAWWLKCAIAGLMLLVVVAPLWVGRYLPFLDLPQHLALSAAIARYADPSAGFATYYQIDWSVTPYWAFYTLMHLLIAIGVAPLTAARLLLSAYAAGLPLSAAYLLASLGRDWRWAAFTL